LQIRPYTPADLDALAALDASVVGWWHERLPTRHLIAEEFGRVVGHLQVANVGSENARRRGECSLILRVADDAWAASAPNLLLVEALTFGRSQQATRLVASFTSLQRNLGDFLRTNGFEPFERYHPISLDVQAFDPSRFSNVRQRCEEAGIRFRTYKDLGDSPAHRRLLYDLECAVREDQPFRDVGDFTPPAYDIWEAELAGSRWDTIFLAVAEGRWLGLVHGLDWPFTGVHPTARGRGIATALKVWAISFAKAEGFARVDTESHEDNTAMRAVNRKLGFVGDVVETNCRRLIT